METHNQPPNAQKRLLPLSSPHRSLPHSPSPSRPDGPAASDRPLPAPCSTCGAPAAWRESGASARRASAMGLPLIRACNTHRTYSMLPAYGGIP